VEHREHKLTQSVVRVRLGRGFVVELATGELIVITAAHCLQGADEEAPKLPPCHALASYTDRTYKALLGLLEEAEPTVWGECQFVDPVADIAVIGSPQDQELSDKAAAYQRLMSSMLPLPIADAPKHGLQFAARILSLDNRWVECSVTRWWEKLSIERGDLVVPGMSGSPIVSAEGQVIGVITVGGEKISEGNPVLTDNLPLKFLRPGSASCSGGPD
jgi:hypothetical protein